MIRSKSKFINSIIGGSRVNLLEKLSFKDFHNILKVCGSCPLIFQDDEVERKFLPMPRHLFKKYQNKIGKDFEGVKVSIKGVI